MKYPACPISLVCNGCHKHTHGLNLFGSMTKECPFDPEFDCKCLDDAPAKLLEMEEKAGGREELIKIVRQTCDQAGLSCREEELEVVAERCLTG